MDRCVISDRDAVQIIAATAEALGHHPQQLLEICRSSILSLPSSYMYTSRYFREFQKEWSKFDKINIADAHIFNEINQPDQISHFL